MGRIIHVEVTSGDPQQATDFYRRAFGWTTEESPFLPDYFIADTGEGPGINGAVMSNSYRSQSVIIWMEVDDLATTMADVRAAGGSQVGDINEIPGEGKVCYIEDPQGTVFGLKENP